jgi:acyl carrier protein
MDESQILTVILEIISEMLEIPVLEVAADADLFELGFHSLLVFRMLRQIREKIGVELNPVDLFVKPTANGIAAKVYGMRAQGVHR